MKKLTLAAVILLYFVLFFYQRCAHKVAPSGGPEDKSPPSIIFTYPAPDSVNVKQLSYIEVEFSEAIRKSTLGNNFWIIPDMSSGFNIQWRGSRKIRFYFKDTLETNQTYVFTLGTGIKDLRNNGLSAPMQLAFSTGSVIDSGSIRGKIFSDRKNPEVFIFAYHLKDTINLDLLSMEEPQYYTQANNLGEFNLDYLPPGFFRLIALIDENQNKKYDFSIDFIGLPAFDITLDSLNRTTAQIDFFIIQEDSIRPKVLKTEAVSKKEIMIQFTEPIQFYREADIQLSDSVTNQIYTPLYISLNTKEKNISLFSSDIPTDRSLTLELKNIMDLSGNMISDSTLILRFPSSIPEDTTTPKLMEVLPGDGTSDVPLNKPITVSFNVPIDSTLFSEIFLLLDENNKVVTGSFDFKDLRIPVFTADTLFVLNKKYTIRIRLDSLKTIWGELVSDSVFISSFFVQKQEDLGEISGIVMCPDNSNRKAIIELKQLETNSIYNHVVNLEKEYLIENLPAGPYFITAILDRNSNLVWDKGKTNPWEFSESFIFREDTVFVRKRWTTQGINFNFGN
jgi:hypothetical protein